MPRHMAALASSLLVVLSGCAFAPRSTFSTAAYDYNLLVEESQNQMMLVNIVRAMDRRPMYFTSLSTIRGSISASAGTGSMTIPFGGPGKGYSVAPTISYSTSPSFDFVPLDSKNFVRGVLTPVPLDTFKYYWDQGWPRPLLLSMLIRTIQTRKDDGTLESQFDNYPDDSSSLKHFQMELKELFPCAYSAAPSDAAKCSLELDDDPVTDASLIGGGTLPLVDLDAKALAEVQKAGLTVIHRCAGAGGKRIECQPGDKGQLHLSAKKPGTHLKIDATKACTSGSRGGGEKAVANAPPASCKLNLFVRSPEAMLYYLGEIMRAEQSAPLADLKNPNLFGVCAVLKNSARPLFYAKEAQEREDPDAIVSVKYDSRTYIIPRQVEPGLDNTCSMEALTLVSQLIGEQKDLSELPVTGTVNVVGVH